MNPERDWSDFDWGKVKVRQVGGKTPKPKEGKFVRVPLGWVEKLSKAKYVSTLKLAHYLLNVEWRSPGQPIRLSNLIVERLGLSRNQKARGIAELRSLDLVQIEAGKPRQSPLVRLKLEVSGG
jgi:hypothetical protein